MYSMKDFILQGLPPTHTNWGRKEMQLPSEHSLPPHPGINNDENDLDIAEHSRQVVGFGSQTEVVKDIILQCIQMWIVHEHWPEKFGIVFTLLYS